MGKPRASQSGRPPRTAFTRSKPRTEQRRGHARAIATRADRRDRPVARQGVEPLGRLAGADVDGTWDVRLEFGRWRTSMTNGASAPPGARSRKGVDVVAVDLHRTTGPPPCLEAAADVAAIAS